MRKSRGKALGKHWGSIGNHSKALGRIGKAQDVAMAALYFASEDSSWTTGAILPVDGGVAAK